MLSFIFCFFLSTSGPDTSFYLLFLQILELLQYRHYGYGSSPFTLRIFGVRAYVVVIWFYPLKDNKGKTQILLGRDLSNLCQTFRISPPVPRKCSDSLLSRGSLDISLGWHSLSKCPTSLGNTILWGVIF